MLPFLIVSYIRIFHFLFHSEMIIQRATMNEYYSASPIKWKWGHMTNGVVKAYFSTTMMQYHQSVAYCAENEAFLAEITSEEDRIFFQDLLKEISRNETILPDIWIGHLFDSKNNVWKKRSDNLIIDWKGWLMYNAGNTNFPILSNQIGTPSDQESLSSITKNFFCVKYLPHSPFRDILKGMISLLSSD